MNSAILDVQVEYDDFMRAHESALKHGFSPDIITVAADVDIDEALEHATVDDLRGALAREEVAYTQDQIAAIHDCFASAVSGDVATARALLGRIFEHQAQINAAEQGMRAISGRLAA